MKIDENGFKINFGVQSSAEATDKSLLRVPKRLNLIDMYQSTILMLMIEVGMMEVGFI